MIIKIGDYEVKIEAKETTRNSKMNKTDTMILLNHMCNAFFQTEKWYTGQGLHMLAKQYHEQAMNLFDQLTTEGFYEKFPF